MSNYNAKYINHALYLNKETIKEKITIKNKLGISTYSFQKLWDYENTLCGLESLIVQPQYLNKEMIDFINEKQIKCLYLEDRIIGGFFEKELDKYKTLVDLSFLKNIPHLKCFKIDAYTPFFAEKPIVKIEDYTPIESLKELEYIYIPDNGAFPISVNVNFSKLQQLKDVYLQYPKENKTIYKCENLESVYTRYYEKDLHIMKNWKKLKYFSAYCDDLKSFEGLEQFKKLEIFRPETTSAFKTFKDTNSKSIKTFMLYTEARNTPKTLEGIGGLEVAELIALNGLKKLEDLGDLYKCQNLKELRLERCHIPNSIGDVVKRLPKLERLILDDCGDIESIAFVKEIPSLKYLSVSENSKIIDGNLDFLKALAQKGVEIHFTPRKHYTITYDDVVIE
jgi:hypothetical protein